MVTSVPCLGGMISSEAWAKVERNGSVYYPGTAKRHGYAVRVPVKLRHFDLDLRLNVVEKLEWKVAPIPLEARKVKWNPRKRQPSPFIRIDPLTSDFTQKWINHVFEKADSDPACFRLMILTRLNLLLGQNFQRRHVVREKPYDPVETRHKGLSENDSGAGRLFSSLDEPTLKRIWATDIPRILGASIVPLVAREKCDTTALYAELQNALTSEGGKETDFSSRQKNFKNLEKRLLAKIGDSAALRSQLATLSLTYQQEMHRDFSDAVKQAMVNVRAIPELAKSSTFAATEAYVRFWYTLESPWATNLCGLVPAFGTAASSFFFTLAADMQDSFEQRVFMENAVPARRCLEELFNRISGYENWLERVQEAHRNQTPALHAPEFLIDQEPSAATSGLIDAIDSPGSAHQE